MLYNHFYFKDPRLNFFPSLVQQRDDREFDCVDMYKQPEFDCVDIYKQPAFDHPLLKNHKIQAPLDPTYFGFFIFIFLKIKIKS